MAKTYPCPTPHCISEPFTTRFNLNRHLEKRRCKFIMVLNPVISDCLELWKSVPSWTPFNSIILEFLHHLTQQQFSIPELQPIFTRISDSFQLAPTLEHVLIDLNVVSNHRTYFRASSQAQDSKINRASFELSFHARNNSLHFGYSAFNFKPTTHGLLSCNPIQPEHFTGLRWEGTYNMTSVCTPEGNFTNLHIDSSILGAYVIQLVGKKLWLTWPRSKHNLQELSQIHLNPSVPTITLLKPLQGLRIILLQPGVTFYMPPGTMHAVISFNQSALTGYPVARIEDIPAAQAALLWEFNHLTTVFAKNKPVLKTAVTEWNNGLVYWRHLHFNHPEQAILDFIHFVETHIEFVKSIITPPPKSSQQSFFPFQPF